MKDSIENTEEEIPGKVRAEIAGLKEQVEDLKEQQKEDRERIAILEEKVEELKTVRKKSGGSGDKVLQRYSADTSEQFLEELKDAAKEGLSYTDITRIFNVQKSKAYSIMSDIEDDYSFIERKEGGGNIASVLRHKKHAYAEELAEGHRDTKEEIIKKFEEKASGGETPVYKLMEEELEKEKDRKKI